MPNLQQSAFPVVEEVLQLWRSIVNDTFRGLTGPGSGRIATDNAQFTLPFLNSAFRTLQRKLRLEGVTFPIKDNVLLLNLTPLAAQDPGKQVNVGFDGYFDGTLMNAEPKLPGDCMQVLAVWQQIANSGLPYYPMIQPMEGIPSEFQGQVFFWWEWRNYRINLNGALQAINLRIRYQSGQPPITAPAANFPNTPIYILDCQDALANMMAHLYGTARGASDASLATVQANADAAVSDMAQEYVRRQQSVNYRRPAYSSGNSDSSGNTGTGSGGLW